MSTAQPAWVLGAKDNERLVTDEDTYERAVFRQASRPLEVSSQNPLRIVVIDADLLSDDPVGTAMLPVRLAARGGEFDLPIIDEKGRVTGSVKLRIVVVGTE